MLDYREYDNHNLIINTACEHMTQDDFNKWIDLLPTTTRIILQSNDYFGIAEHVNCSASLEEFDKITPMSETLYIGKFDFTKYSRFMKIGYKQ